MTNIYYICSYGGCGSKMLLRFISKYAPCYHIHSRVPPTYLEFVNNGHFNGNVIENKDVSKYKVIYIFRNPSEAQMSIFSSLKKRQLKHWSNIQVKDSSNIPEIEEYLKRNVDSLNYMEFFNNYIENKINLNYSIIAINYHKLWNNIPELIKILELPIICINKFPKKKEKSIKKYPNYVKGLNIINKQLVDKIHKMPSIILLNPM